MERHKDINWTRQDQESLLLKGKGSTARLTNFHAYFDDKYFVSEHENLRELLKTTKNLPRIEIGEKEIVTVFSNISATLKGAEPDRISPLLFQKCIYNLLPIIYFIFQLSVNRHDLLTIWKVDEIISISKKPIVEVDNDLAKTSNTHVNALKMPRMDQSSQDKKIHPPIYQPTSV